MDVFCVHVIPDQSKTILDFDLDFCWREFLQKSLMPFKWKKTQQFCTFTDISGQNGKTSHFKTRFELVNQCLEMDLKKENEAAVVECSTKC